MELAVTRLNRSKPSHTSFREAMVEHFAEQIDPLHLKLGLVTVGMQADRFGVPVYFTNPEGMKTPEGAEWVDQPHRFSRRYFLLAHLVFQGQCRFDCSANPPEESSI